MEQYELLIDLLLKKQDAILGQCSHTFSRNQIHSNISGILQTQLRKLNFSTQSGSSLLESKQDVSPILRNETRNLAPLPLAPGSAKIALSVRSLSIDISVFFPPAEALTP